MTQLTPMLDNDGKQVYLLGYPVFLRAEASPDAKIEVTLTRKKLDTTAQREIADACLDFFKTQEDDQ